MSGTSERVNGLSFCNSRHFVLQDHGLNLALPLNGPQDILITPHRADPLERMQRRDDSSSVLLSRCPCCTT